MITGTIIDARARFALDMPITDHEQEPTEIDRHMEKLESATLFLRWIARSAAPGKLRDEARHHWQNLRSVRAELPEGGIIWMARLQEIEAAMQELTTAGPIPVA